MFKCKECGSEYETKPDYCDCGNDSFEEIKEKDNITENSAPKIENVDFKAQNKTEPYVIKPATERFSPRSVNIPSLIIFCFCVLLSFLIVFVWNPVNTAPDDVDKNNIAQNKTVVNPNIPASIDKLWNNALPVQKEPKTVVQEKKVLPISEPVQKTITVVPLKKINTNIKKAKQTNIGTKVTKPVQTAKSAAKSSASQKKETKKQNVSKPVQQQVQQQLKQPASRSVQSQPTQVQQTKPAASVQQIPETSQKSQAALREEFAKYKMSLRNTIGKKIDFTKVIGDGSCTVSFKINSSGTLVNRNFAKQSSNMTLNDAVYKAVMSTPNFNPPPDGYNNETLNLSISFYNGNFEITLK